MVIQSNDYGAHYGPVLLRETPEEDILRTCRGWAKVWTSLVRRLFPEAAQTVSGVMLAVPEGL